MTIATQLSDALKGRYTVGREIGRGGMATVYLAHEVRHNREVALKLLDPELGAVLGVERFLAEISVTAKLQHPNLLPLFDSGEANGLLFYVMPFVDGETLRARLTREKQLPVDEAIHIAVAVANALDYAHEHGVIHRDLKPENILLQHGQPVVADFGIALAISNSGGARVTQTGLSLGTPQYMSPEQATGDRDIDARADVYALGAVLYEMLTGEPPHTGTTAQAIIAKLMTEQPRPVTMLRPSVPASVDAAVRRALEKLPADRWRSARAFADALSGAAPIATMGRIDDPTMPASGSRSATLRGRARRLAPWAIAAVATIVAVAAMRSVYTRPGAGDAPTIRFAFTTPDSERYINSTGIPFAMSSDDRMVVFTGFAPSGDRLYVRDLADMSTKAIPGTDGAVQPLLSPDGRWVVFSSASGALLKVSVEGGTPTTILSLNPFDYAGGSWTQPDTIIASIRGALVAVPVDGGAPVSLARPDSAHGEVLQWGPQPARAGYMGYIAVSPQGPAFGHVGILDLARRRTQLTPYLGTTVLGSVDGRLLWITSTGRVMAARVGSNGTLATPQQVPVENVLVGPGGAAKAILSAHGSLLYRRGIALEQLVVLDDKGTATDLGAESSGYRHPRWSPDGTRIAVSVVRPDGADISLVDASTGAASVLTPANGSFDAPAWTPDGRRLVFNNLNGYLLEWMATDHSDSATTLVSADMHPWDGVVTRDGRWLIYRTATISGRRDLNYMPLDGSDHTSHAFLTAPADNVTPDVSPDGRWVAYMSFATGQDEIYARAFPTGGGAIQISVGGGREPRWSPDGRTIYYRAVRTIVAADVSAGSTLTVVRRRKVFDDPYVPDPTIRDYDVSPDGKHFLMVRAANRDAETMVVYGWANELRRAWR